MAVPVEIIQSKIYLIRRRKVMFDKDLVELYGVSTKQLTRQVRRNAERFPDDFLIKLTRKELDNLRCQIGTSSWGGTRYLPCVFTEQGVAMLSSVLNSKRAIQVNIQIMRVFTKLREMLLSHKELAHKIEDLERKFVDHDGKIAGIFDAIKRLLIEKEESIKNKGPMGFVIPQKTNTVNHKQKRRSEYATKKQ